MRVLWTKIKYKNAFSDEYIEIVCSTMNGNSIWINVAMGVMCCGWWFMSFELNDTVLKYSRYLHTYTLLLIFLPFFWFYVFFFVSNNNRKAKFSVFVLFFNFFFYDSYQFLCVSPCITSSDGNIVCVFFSDVFGKTKSCTTIW